MMRATAKHWEHINCFEQSYVIEHHLRHSVSTEIAILKVV